MTTAPLALVDGQTDQGASSAGVKRQGRVDRTATLMARPWQVRRLLEHSVVLARITKAEHARLGGIYTHHRQLYVRMLESPIDALPHQGRRRYQKVGIKLIKSRRNRPSRTRTLRRR
ncbi:MAG: hypothetical protein M3O77_01915 [Chloroflexota bacterium]|nr:hypothetical protein [Chloroflexota bacterium]